MQVSWQLAAITVHLAVVVSIVLLYPKAPDWLQKLVLGLLFASFTTFMGLEIAEVVGVYFHWWVRRAAHLVEHIALVLYVFRLVVRYQEHKCLPKSSVSSRTYKVQ